MTTNNHTARASAWALMTEWSTSDGDDDAIAGCLLELRARVERLEQAATCPHIVSSDEGTSYCGLGQRQALLAEAQPQPVEPTGAPTQADLRQLFNEQSGYLNDTQVLYWPNFYHAVRAALQRWGRTAPEPVSVAERLPTAQDCDAEGRCWMGTWNLCDDKWIPDWELSTPAHYTWKGIAHITCWLPHWALPVPQEQADE